MENVAEEGWAQTLKFIGQIWNLELFSIDTQPLTVGKGFTGILLLIVGYWVSRRATNAVDRKLLNQVEPSLRYTVRRAIFYFFLFISTLFILRILNVPITIFTVLGGALAIGVGFGSQNIVNNFISGLIMMVEQPIRVGDYVEVEGVTGTIEMIGTRSTIMRNPDNKHIILPNSFFLEKSLVNWTLVDATVRGKINVGVAYGSDLQLVKKLLLQAATQHSEVLKNPEPVVLFKDFGDSALIFTLHIWSAMGGLRGIGDAESDLRFTIDKLFRDNHVSMPFPQREIRMVETVQGSRPLRPQL